MRALADILLAQRGHLIGWVPVCLGAGIGFYFALRFEPSVGQLAGAGLVVLSAIALCRIAPLSARPLLVGVALFCMGAGLGSWRTHQVAAPKLEFRYYGPIEGRIVGMDRSFSDAVRLTLDRVRLDRVAADRVPAHVRIAIHGDLPKVPFRPGQRIMTTGHLSPPAGPAEPGGFDFQRHAWFLRLGAVGYTRNPTLRATPARQDDWRTWIFSKRMQISGAVQTVLPGEPGAIAAAITTGDRSGIHQNTLAHLRATNLAHLLAISGLHMGLLTGFVFGALRVSLMAVPAVGLRVPTKKIAAFGALAVAAVYLLLSGGNVATERAFVMVAVMLAAILLDRPALTLRAVAIAATVILVMQPEALLGPGFQMSFAATTALVAVFQAIRVYGRPDLPPLIRQLVSLVLASTVAGLATAPIAAAHFNQFSHYGLIANVLSVPLMGAVIMPAAVVAACLAPLGLSEVGLTIMGWGITWILKVAETIAALPGALGHVPTPSFTVLPILAGGALIIVLLQGRIRWAGVPAIAGAFALWVGGERPPLLIAESGGLIGILTAEGRALSRPTGDGFVASVWLENDGAVVDQSIARVREGIVRDGRSYAARLGHYRILQVAGKTALAEIEECDGADILVSNQKVATPRPCLVFDQTVLRETGAVTLALDKDNRLVIRKARAEIGARPWNNWSGDSETSLTRAMKKPQSAVLLPP